MGLRELEPTRSQEATQGANEKPWDWDIRVETRCRTLNVAFRWRKRDSEGMSGDFDDIWIEKHANSFWRECTKV